MPSYTAVYSQGRTRAFFASASTTLVALLMASQAWGSGFQIKEQNITNLGTAYAGTAAHAADASSAWYNPAAITRIKKHQLVIAGAFIHADNEFNPDFATNMAGTVLPSRGEEEANKLSFVPSLHYTAEINDHVYLGLSVTTPFGLATEYSENSILRYMATRSELRTVDISPSIAYRLNDHFSFAVGADAVWAKAHLDLQTSFTNPAIPGGTLVDGFQRNSAEDWGWGYHLAVLWEMCENTRFGATYRSHVNIHADGESEAVNPTNPAAGAASALRTIYSAHANVTLPETLDISAYHAFNSEFAVMADVSWTNWSKFRTLRLRYDAPPTALDGTGRTPTDTFEHWDDTMRVALGMEYTPCDKYKLRFGVAWDESPVDTQFRTARIPDSDRIWVGVGLGFALSQNMWVDLGYAHIFFRDANIDERSPFVAQTTTPSTVAELRGKFNTSVDIAGLQFRWTFN
jgi:long-chain fatty acid transport protein